ncbi:phage tail protein [Paucibacter sp. KCTC 42545]|uniref:phage tail protein n=1 Tax=Paucibacter sp. KCTC 42545 TaxID=1768242 RepID=UPI0009EC3B63|nr:tail fiber protein [Paucibacter sp. KCTC 42545]
MSLQQANRLARQLRGLGLSVCLLGATASWADTPFLGETACGIWNFAPKGWALMNGQLLSIQQNQALFSLLGTSYGGNGIQTFALPDTRGRVVIGAGAQYQVGDRGGTEAVTLTTAQMPMHNHEVALPGSASIGDTQSPAGKSPASQSRSTLYAAPSVPGVDMSPASVASAGGNQPVSVMQPSLTLTCVIALQGIFPSRD